MPDTSAHHLEWLADKIVSGNDYCKEAAEVMRAIASLSQAEGGEARLSDAEAHAALGARGYREAYDAGYRAALHSAPVPTQEAKPINVEAVATVVRYPDHVRLDWLIEGGPDALVDGQTLCISDRPITDDDGAGTVYLASPTQEAVSERTAEPTDEQIMALWQKHQAPEGADSWAPDVKGFARAVLCLAAPATEPTDAKLFKTTVLGVGPYCVEFPDGEIIHTRTEARQKAIAIAASAKPAGGLERLYKDAREVFDADGPETPQVVRDVIEWYAASIRVVLAANPPGAEEASRTVERYKNGNTALLEALMDMVFQHCARSSAMVEDLVFHDYISANENAVEILEQTGMLIDGKLQWEALEARKPKQQTWAEAVNECVTDPAERARLLALGDTK